MHEAAVALGHVVLPEAVVPGAIGPYLNTAPISFACLSVPLTLIQSHVGHALHGLDNSLYLVLLRLDAPVERFQQLDDFRYDLVLVVVEEYFEFVVYEGVVYIMPMKK